MRGDDGRAVVSAVRNLHAARWVGVEHQYAICVECRQVWPCETLRVVSKAEDAA